MIKAIKKVIGTVIVFAIVTYVYSRMNVRYDVLGTPHLYYGDEEL